MCILRRRDDDGRRRRGRNDPEALHVGKQTLERVRPRGGREVAEQRSLPPQGRGTFGRRSSHPPLCSVLDRPDLRGRRLPGDEERRNGCGRRHDGPRRFRREESRGCGVVRPDDGGRCRGLAEPESAGHTQPQVIRVRDRIQMQYNIPIVAVRGYVKYQPDDGFQFQLNNKMNFDKRQTGGVDVQSGDVTEAEAKSQAAALAHKFAEKQAKTRVDNLESIQVYPTTYDGELLHAPVWFMEYAHKGKQMFILVDGSSGGVMDGERPGFSLW